MRKRRQGLEILDFFDAGAADALVAEVDDVVGIVAEDAEGLILLEHDAVAVGEDL